MSEEEKVREALREGAKRSAPSVLSRAFRFPLFATVSLPRLRPADVRNPEPTRSCGISLGPQFEHLVNRYHWYEAYEKEKEAAEDTEGAEVEAPVPDGGYIDVPRGEVSGI